MPNQDDWAILMRSVANGVAEIEEMIATLEDNVVQSHRLAERAARGEIPEETLLGLRLGLTLARGMEWFVSAPQKLSDLDAQLAAHDARVESGEVPSSGHSWRYQLRMRMASAKETLERLSRRYVDSLSALKAPSRFP